MGISKAFKLGRDSRTGEYVGIKEAEKNLDRYEIIEIQDWEPEFIRLHYEPEHDRGGFCWCNPRKVSRNGSLEIEHNQNRAQLIEFIKNLLKNHSA